MRTRICKRCGHEKNIADFHKTDKYKEWYRKECKDCRNEFHKEYREFGKQTILAKVRVSSQKAIDATIAWQRKHPEKHNKWNIEYRARLRHETIMAYGGYKCVCCGETEPLFLTLDHIHNDGAKWREFHKDHRGAQLFKWLKQNNWPKGFQILCLNCNQGKYRNKGICPHQVKKV